MPFSKYLNFILLVVLHNKRKTFIINIWQIEKGFVYLLKIKHRVVINGYMLIIKNKNMEQIDEFLKPNVALDRLIREYNDYGYLCIGVDFDDTLSPYENLKGTHHQVIQLIKDLRVNITCKIVCWTANPNIEYVKEYLAKHEIPYDGINCDGIIVGYPCRKPVFSALLDDRAGLKETYDYLTDFLTYIKQMKEDGIKA